MILPNRTPFEGGELVWPDRPRRSVADLLGGGGAGRLRQVLIHRWLVSDDLEIDGIHGPGSSGCAEVAYEDLDESITEPLERYADVAIKLLRELARRAPTSRKASRRPIERRVEVDERLTIGLTYIAGAGRSTVEIEIGGRKGAVYVADATRSTLLRLAKACLRLADVMP